MPQHIVVKLILIEDLPLVLPLVNLERHAAAEPDAAAAQLLSPSNALVCVARYLARLTALHYFTAR